MFVSWKKADPSRKLTTVEQYIASQGITSGITERPSSSSSMPFVLHDVYERNAMDQSSVKLHRSEYDY